MPHKSLDALRKKIRSNNLKNEALAIQDLCDVAKLDHASRQSITERGAKLVAHVRSGVKPSLMEAFLAEYGLSTKEGLALMCLAEALLRVPDAGTMDDLIEDKIMEGEWSKHAGQSISQLVNVSTMGLQVTNAVLNDGSQGVNTTLRTMVKRVGMPIIRTAVKQVMKELGRQFVLGQDMKAAQKQAQKFEKEGFTYSYDMLGEAAHTSADAEKYYQAYIDAIKSMASSCAGDVKENPGISIKLSALHPRYEQNNIQRVMNELTPKVLNLAQMATKANMGLNIDAEEADRLDLSLNVIESVLQDKSLKDWHGFGVVVQAYGKRAKGVINWLYALAGNLDRKIMVRLVKGAYWDAEIKRAQVLGIEGFPVFTQKAHSDISYIACAKILFDMTDRIYPQFATHNAHTVAAVLHFSHGSDKDQFEFQRLHGMGESLHMVLREEEATRCRIYAPVGVHRDLLAYLVRRLLENGANSSFVNQIVDTAIPPLTVAADPFESAKTHIGAMIKMPPNIFGSDRKNSKGWDISDIGDLTTINNGRDLFTNKQWQAAPILATPPSAIGEKHFIENPADLDDIVGEVTLASEADVNAAFNSAASYLEQWANLPCDERAHYLEKTADLFEKNTHELFALLTREAGKSLADAISEVREAVDFLRFYAAEARRRDYDSHIDKARGVFVCISPWNFPLAIFIGQISAALAAGNTVIAKPAEQTPLIAARAIELMLEAEIPNTAIQLLPGTGPTIGAALTSHKDLAGVCFTGSTATAQTINRTMAKNCAPNAPLVAETGGLNAMIVDSTALPEQAVQDIVESAFQSAGQRCSALRMLYIQEDVKDRFLAMLYGAMDELEIGNPWNITCDVGPVIDKPAQEIIQNYCETMEADGRLLKKLTTPTDGQFVAPTAFAVSGIEELNREIFGPILHIATFKAEELADVVNTINDQGYGLTMGLHSRIDDRIDLIKKTAKVGNLYINRNQIGAVVGCQPFGGEGLSGTGPKAGGPSYLDVFRTNTESNSNATLDFDQIADAALLQQATKTLQASASINLEAVRAQLCGTFAGLFYEQSSLINDLFRRLQKETHGTLTLPSPVGESNVLNIHACGIILCQSNNLKAQISHVVQSLYFGNKVIIAGNLADKFKDLQGQQVQIIEGGICADDIRTVSNIAAVCMSQKNDEHTEMRIALSKAAGPIIPLVTEPYSPYRFTLERHCCIDTTAAGGDVELLKGGAIAEET